MLVGGVDGKAGPRGRLGRAMGEGRYGGISSKMLGGKRPDRGSIGLGMLFAGRRRRMDREPNLVIRTCGRKNIWEPELRTLYFSHEARSR